MTDLGLNTTAFVQQAVDNTLKGLGFSLEQLDLSPLTHTDGTSQQRMAVATGQQMWRRAVALTGNDAFGVLVSEKLSPTHLSGLGVSLMACAHCHDALQLLLRFSSLVSTAVSIDVAANDRGVWVILGTPKFEAYEQAWSGLDLYTATLVRFVRLFTGVDATSPLMVEFERPKPDNVQAFHSHFCCPVRFGASSTRVLFGDDTLERPYVGSNPALVAAGEKMAEVALSEIEGSFSYRVEQALISSMPGTLLSAEQVAAKLGTSVRNMQRRLASENRSFREIHEQARADFSRHLLKCSGDSIGHISYRLGFADQSSFVKAFKRWTGRTPSEYRRRGVRSA